MIPGKVISFLCVGTIIIIFTGFGRYQRYVIARNGIDTEATVTKIKNGSVYYEYKVDGKDYESKVTYFTKPKKFSVGDKVMVRYHGDNPQRIIVPDHAKFHARADDAFFNGGLSCIILALIYATMHFLKQM